MVQSWRKDALEHHFSHRAASTQHLPLYTANHTHEGPCFRWMLLGWCSTSKAASRTWLGSGTQGQALRRRRLGGAKYRSNERNRSCMCVQGSSTERWTVEEQNQSWGCRGKGRHFHTVNHSLFFPVRLQKQQSCCCTKHRQKHSPLSAGFPMHGPSALPHTPAVLLTLGSSLWLSMLRLQHG